MADGKFKRWSFKLEHVMSFSSNLKRPDTPSALEFSIWIGLGPLIGIVLFMGGLLFN